MVNRQTVKALDSSLLNVGAEAQRTAQLKEVLEALRDGDPKSTKIPEFSCVEEELADLLIRLAGFGYEFGYRLAEATEAKMKYNESREYLHGRKF